MKKVLVIFLLLLSACSSTGVIPVGGDSYMVSKQTATGFQSAVGIKGEILKEANESVPATFQQDRPRSLSFGFQAPQTKASELKSLGKLASDIEIHSSVCIVFILVNIVLDGQIEITL